MDPEFKKRHNSRWGSCILNRGHIRKASFRDLLVAPCKQDTPEPSPKSRQERKANQPRSLILSISSSDIKPTSSEPGFSVLYSIEDLWRISQTCRLLVWCITAGSHRIASALPSRNYGRFFCILILPPVPCASPSCELHVRAVNLLNIERTTEYTVQIHCAQTVECEMLR